MPRKPRLYIPGGVYHVTLRGNNRQQIFIDDEDRITLSKMWAEGRSRYHCRVHTYCWMTNHLHAIVQVSTEPLGALMRWLASHYARTFNRRHARRGHLFERRHHAILVDVDGYLLQLVRYIHLNPVRAGLVARPAEYPWSSHHAYQGLSRTEWLTTELVLSLFNDTEHVARERLSRFVDAADCSDRGGIAAPPVPETDPRVLGDGPFVASTLARTTVCRPRGLDELDVLVQHWCRKLGLSSSAICAPGKHRRHAQARALIAREAIRTGTATLAELARCFGRSDSVVLRTMERYKDLDFADPPDGPRSDANCD